jgi:hypothetical protein
MARQALLEALILKHGEPIARKLLGLEQRSQNPKYAISLGNMKIDPMRMLANQGMKGIMSGGKMSSMLGPGLLLGGALGLGYLTNPLREGSYNYNPELQGQIDYASGKGYIGKNSNTGLMQYGPSSILSGQNVVSGFGTNDYGKQLQNYKDKYGDTMSQERLDQLNKEIEDLTTDEFDKVDEFMSAPTPTQTGPTYKGMSSVGSGGNGSGSSSSKSSSSKSSSSGSSRHGSGPGGLHSNYRRGGIASL